MNIAELNHGLPDFDWARYTSGIVLALVSVVCWAWYALRNARWLRENPDKHPMMGNGAGAGHAAGFSHWLSRRLLLAEYANAGLLPTLWPPSAGIY